MNVVLEAGGVVEPEFTVFIQNRVRFSLRKLFWLVHKIKVKYSIEVHSRTACNQVCSIEIQTFNCRPIEVSITARDQRTALEMGLKKIHKLLQKTFHQSQQYGRISRRILR